MGDFLLVAFLLSLGIGGYWVFILMPRQHTFIQRQKMARELKAGDEIVTGGGLVGKIQRIDADGGVAFVQIADGLQVRVLTAAILDLYDPEKIAKNAQTGQQTPGEFE